MTIARALRLLAAARRRLDDAESALRAAGLVQRATVERAKDLIVTEVGARPRQLSTSGLRRVARNHRLSTEAVTRALVDLQREGKLGFEPGARASKLWFLADGVHDASSCVSVSVSTDAKALNDPAGAPEASAPQNGAEARAGGPDSTEPNGVNANA